MSKRGLYEADGAARSAGAMVPGLDPRFARPRTLFFCIGAQKTATSWLHVYLSGHPDVCLPVHKEQHYWTALRLPSANNWAARVLREVERIEASAALQRLLRGPRQRTADRAWQLMHAMLREPTPAHRAYADVLFQTWRGEPVVGEITPAYALLPAEAFTEMADLGHDVRFLFIMRDPILRLISGARMIVRRRAAGSGIRQGAEQLDEAVPEGWLLRSRYDMTIRNLESAVPRERIAYFFYETLFRQSEIDRLCDFLRVARRPAQFERRVHADPGTKIALPPNFEASATKALAPTYKFVRERFGDLVPETWRT